MAGFDETALQKRVRDYIHKSRVLRQIQSGKLQRTSRWSFVLDYTTIGVSAIITFTTFSGVSKVYNLFFTNYIGLDRLEFAFKGLSLCIRGHKMLERRAQVRDRTDREHDGLGWR
jgi:hypothetical protein